MTKSLAAAALLALTLSGCQTQGWQANQVINEPAVEKVQAEIKRQIAVYLARARIAKANPNREATWCGTGSIDFDVVSVKADLLTTHDVIGSANAGATIPIAPVTLTAKVSTSKDVTNTQHLTYTEYSVSDALQPADLQSALLDQQPAPIADLIMWERNALIRATLRSLHAGPQPCFTDFDPNKPGDPATQIEVGLKIATDTQGNLSVGLGPVSVGGGAEVKNSFANTVTVAFKQAGVTSKTLVGPCHDDPHQVCTFEPIEAAAAKPAPKKPPIAYKPVPHRHKPHPGKPVKPRLAPMPKPAVPEPAVTPATTPPPPKMCHEGHGGVGILVDVPCPVKQ